MEVLLKKHEDFESTSGAHDDRIRTLSEQANKLIHAGHYDAERSTASSACLELTKAVSPKCRHALRPNLTARKSTASSACLNQPKEILFLVFIAMYLVLIACVVIHCGEVDKKTLLT